MAVPFRRAGTFHLGCALVLRMSRNNLCRKPQVIHLPEGRSPSEERTQRKGTAIPHNRRQSHIEKKSLLKKKSCSLATQRSSAATKAKDPRTRTKQHQIKFEDFCFVIIRVILWIVVALQSAISGRLVIAQHFSAGEASRIEASP